MVNLIILYSIAGFFLIAFTVLFVYFLYLRFSDKEDPQDKPLLLIFGHRFAKGHVFGFVDKVIRKKDRTCFIFFPRDIDYVRMQNDKEYKIEPIKIWVENEKEESLPKITFSEHRNLIMIYPKYAEELTDSFRKTDIGKAIMEITEDRNSRIEKQNCTRKRIDSQNKILDEIADVGNILNRVIDLQTSSFKEGLKSKEQTSYGKNPGGSSWQGSSSQS